MIKVSIKKKDDFIKEINLTGHAKYDIYGKDIVCAGVSSLLTFAVNACLSFDKDSIKYTQDKTFSLVNVKEDEITNKLLLTLENMLIELSENYKDNIKIKEE